MVRPALHVLVSVNPRPPLHNTETHNYSCSPVKATACFGDDENIQTHFECAAGLNKRTILNAGATASTEFLRKPLAPLGGAPMADDVQKQVEIKGIKMTTAIYMLVALAAFARPEVVEGETLYQGDTAETKGSAAHSCPISNVRLLWRAENANAVASECASYLESMQRHIHQLDQAQFSTTMLALQELFRAGSLTHTSCRTLGECQLKDKESIHHAFKNAITDVRSGRDFRFRDGEDILQGAFLFNLNNTDTLPKLANIIDNHFEAMTRGKLLELLRKSAAEGPRYLSARWQEAASILKTNWTTTAKDTGGELKIVESRYEELEQLEKWLEQLVESSKRDEQQTLLCYLIQGTIKFNVTERPANADVYGLWDSAFNPIWFKRFLTPVIDMLRTVHVRIDTHTTPTVRAVRKLLIPIWNEVFFAKIDQFRKGTASVWLRELQLARSVNPENMLKVLSHEVTDTQHVALAMTVKALKRLPGHIYVGDLQPDLQIYLANTVRRFLQHSAVGKAATAYAKQLPATTTSLLEFSDAPALRGSNWLFSDESLNETFGELQESCLEGQTDSVEAWRSPNLTAFVTWLKKQTTAAAEQTDRELAALYLTRLDLCLAIQQIHLAIDTLGPEYLAFLEQAGFMDKSRSNWSDLVQSCKDLTLPLIVTNAETDSIARTLSWLLVPQTPTHLQSLRMQLVIIACQALEASALPAPARPVRPQIASSSPLSPVHSDSSASDLTCPLSPTSPSQALATLLSPEEATTTCLAMTPTRLAESPTARTLWPSNVQSQEPSYWSIRAAEPEDNELVATWENTRFSLNFEYPTTGLGVAHTRKELAKRYFPTILGTIRGYNTHDLLGIARPLSSCWLNRDTLAAALASTILGTGHSTRPLLSPSRATMSILQKGTVVNFFSLPPFNQALLSSVDLQGHLARITKNSTHASPLSSTLTSLIQSATQAPTIPSYVEGSFVIDA